MKNQDMKLKVMEAFQEEVYKGIVRIDSETMKKINVRPGDIIEIEGARATVATIDRAYPTDVGQKVIRMDGIMRRNAKTSIGEEVSVKKADIKEAKSITIAPTQKNITVQANPGIFKKGLLGRALVKGDQVSLGGTKRRRRAMEGSPFEDIFDIFERDFVGGFGFSGLAGLNFLVIDTNPKQPVIITENTEIKLNPTATDIVEEKVIDVSYEDIGGLTDEIKKVREMIEIPLKYPEVFSRLGIEPPAGVLLHGPPGSGKTLLARAVASESDANFLLINGPEIMNKFYGESEKRVREIFDEAEKHSPSIIFIDEIDAIAPKREEVHGEVERRVVSQLLTQMDGLKSRGKVIIMGATNRPNSIDPALRRPGRFDREITIGVPDRDGRLAVLKIHTRNMPLENDVDLEKLADLTHGFVGADLSALCKEAAMNVLRKVLPKLNLSEKEKIPKEVVETLIVKAEDFREALKIVRPSAMREVLVETPNIHWDDIGGLDKLKQELKEAVEWPLKHPKCFRRMGIRPPRGILLYGPPGTGKTLLAKAVAKESEANFIAVQGPSLMNKWLGESEKGLRKIFEKARQASPTIIFFDEIDAVAPKRGYDMGTKVTERLVNTFLTEMDGLEDVGDIVIIGATNRPDIMDPSLLRPGRFDRLLLTTPPEEKARLEIFKIHTRNMPLAKDVKLDKLAKESEGYVGADIESVCREAGMLALRENLDAKEIKNKFFEEALVKVKPSIPKETMEKYKKIEESYLSKARAAVITDPPAYVG